VAATGFAQTNTAVEVDASISSFDDDVGTGTFYFKAFLSGNGTQQVQVDDVNISLASFWNRAIDQSRSGTYSMKAGATTGSNEYIAATGLDEADIVFDAWWYNTATTPDICQSVRARAAPPLNDYHVNWEGQWTIAEMPWNPLNSVAGSLPQNTWFKMTVAIQGTSMKVLLDDVQINPASGWLNVGASYASGSVGFRAWSASNNWWIDDVRVRKCVDPEPTASVGAEEGWYVMSGTIASQVLDTGTAGATWFRLLWNETLDSGTDITFEVRASDTAFLKDAASPAWIPVGGTSPVNSGLPSGRYMQWRATLSTSDDARTPVLHDVTVEYY